MEKLQVLVKYRFWILLLIALPLCLYGYYSTHGAIRTATQEREEKLKTTLTGIKAGAAQPNDQWAASLKTVAGQLETMNDDVHVDLWMTQLADMTWPKRVTEFMQPGYRSEIRGETTTDQARNMNATTRFYGKGYEAQIDELYKRFQPVVDGEFRGKEPDWEEKLSIDYATIPKNPRINENVQNLTMDEIWDAQEDIWLTRVLADVFREINRDSENIAQAVVRRVDTLQLLGGDGKPVLATVGGAAGAGGLGGGGMPGGMGGMGGMMSGMGGMPSSGGGVDFNPAEEFGAGGTGAAMGGMGMMGGMGGGMSGMGGPGGAPTAAAVKPERYIGPDDAEGKFRERGFYMKVVVRQDRIADFLATLSSARWPVRIARLHVVENPYYEEITQSAGGGYGPGMGMGPGMGGSGMGVGPGMGGAGMGMSPGMGGMGMGMGGPGMSGYGPDYGGGDYGGGDYGGGYGGSGGCGGGDYGGGDYGGGDYGGGDYGGGDYGGGMMGAGGLGGGGGTASRLSSPLVKSALNNPELVQMTVAGAITVFTPPKEDVLPVDGQTQPIPVEGEPFKPQYGKSEETVASAGG